MQIKKIAIVGGGTAGWLAANHLGVELSRDPEVSITLIESPDVPVIGVGEGTVPRLKQTLQKFGISELDLLTKCDTTFKQAVKFVNWNSIGPGGNTSTYYHPFDPPYPFGYDFTRYWLSCKRDTPFSELARAHELAEKRKSPKQKSSPPYHGIVDYAYHFNAAKFSQLLANNACDKFGVRHERKTISHAAVNENGDISKLVYDDGNSESFDFYVDCSGFRAVLLGQTLGAAFVDKSAQVMSDSALALHTPLSDDDKLHPYTLATAHKSGWVWEIPLTSRKGAGFVYASNFMSDDDAVAEFSRYLGRDVSENDIRKIPMKIGYRSYFWKNNCAALGLAQGFVEPLEATSILVTDFCAQLLAKNFPDSDSDVKPLADHCNEIVAYTWERVIDFVQLHYILSNRRDSDFWIANTEEPLLSDLLRERLALWKIRPPQKSDFANRFDLFGPENYQYILYGMNYHTQSKVIAASEMTDFDRILNQWKSESGKVCESLLSHKNWLHELRRAVERT